MSRLFFQIEIFSFISVSSNVLKQSGQVLNGERQRAVGRNALDHLAIRAGPQWYETASSQSAIRADF